jgi:hypothetical protein
MRNSDDENNKQNSPHNKTAKKIKILPNPQTGEKIYKEQPKTDSREKKVATIQDAILAV